MNYKEIDTKDITFNNTFLKLKSGESKLYSVSMFYKGEPIFIQLDITEIAEIHKNYVILKVNSEIYEFVKNLEKYIRNSVYTNSNIWFGGKQFTKIQIKKSLVSMLYKTDNESFLRIDILETQFPRLKQLVKQNIKPIIKLSSLQFVKDIFTYYIKLNDFAELYNDDIISDLTYPEEYCSD